MNSHDYARQLLDFIDESPSPWHAVASMEKLLRQAEFSRLQEAQKWQLIPGGRYYVIRDGSSLIAWVLGSKPLAVSGFNIIGAHTDSPGLRIKPKPVLVTDNMLRLGVEVYGGPILATFSDRDLSLAGRVCHLTDAGNIAVEPIWLKQPLVRLPNLAIHMNRQVNEEGLKYHKQHELSLLSAMLNDELSADVFFELIAKELHCKVEQLLSWDLNVYDTQKGSLWGARQEFYADSQVDNLASCHAGITAMLDDKVYSSELTAVCAFFDHEEIGSESKQGADGNFLADILHRITFALHANEENYHQTLAQSFLVSVDMAHAYHPNFPNAYEPAHQVLVNKGPVIKVNTNQRYTSESLSAAMFMGHCREINVGWQQYAHRTDMACGSTIGPMLSARLGVRSVDVGSPMWAMHSVRESAGVHDHFDMFRVLRQFLVTPNGHQQY